MKTVKLIICCALISAGSVIAQTTPTTPSQTQTKITPSTNQVPANKNASGQQMQSLPSQPGTPGPAAATPAPRPNFYMVQVPHTKEQCEKIQNEIKEKGPSVMMRFEWGCASGEHIGFARMAGPTADAVKAQLPEGVQKIAKITKVDRPSNNQMEQMHK